jgi:putative nucleotidyltransferase with HDIG domain
VLACFLLGAMLPTAGMALYAYQSVAAHREEQTRQYLRRELQTIRLGVLDRLQVQREALRHAIDRLADADGHGALENGSNDGSGLTAPDPPRGFRRMVMFDRDRRLQARWAATASPLLRAAKRFENAGRPAITLQTVPAPSSDRAVVFMGTTWTPPSGPSRLIVAELDGEQLWGHLRGDSIGSLRVTVRDGEGNRLFSSHGDPEGRRGPDEARSREAGELFLEPTFGAAGWRFDLVETQSLASAPLEAFQVVFPLSIALTLAVVLLLSLHLIRRILGPLHQLEAVAGSLSKGDLEARAAVHSGDEFESLGRTFNTMADHLAQHIGLLETAARIDEAILSTFEIDRIVHRLLEGVCDHAGTGEAAMVLLDRTRPGQVRLQRHHRGAAEHDDLVRVRPLRHETRAFLEQLGERPMSSAWEDLPAAVVGSFDEVHDRALCVPVLLDGVRIGAMFVGAREDQATGQHLHGLGRLVARLSIALHNARLVDRVTRMSEETLEALARAIDATSGWTSGHSKRVTRLAMELGRELGVDHAALDRLYRGGMLHDVGKLGVPPHILDKPGRLTDEEFAEVRRHPALGATILGPLSVFRDIIPVVVQHHEKFDGSGYPEGLTGTEICLEARILAVADVFDALGTDRPYRPAMPLERVVEILRKDAGSHFDPYVIEAFMAVLHRGDLPGVQSQHEPQSASASLEPAHERVS